MKKKLKKKCKPKKKTRIVVKESDEDEQINNVLVDDGDDLKEDLEVLLDNFGHSISEPILTGRSQEKASSVLEVSVRKVVYKNSGKEKPSSDFQVSTEPNSFTFPTTSAHCDDYEAIYATQCQCDCSNIRHPSDSLCNCRNDESFGAELQSSYKKCSCMKCNNCMDCNCQEQQQRMGKRYVQESDDANQYKNEIRGLRKERINRYNLNHIQYSRTPLAPRKSKKWSFFSLWSNKKGNKKQKYKNNIKYMAGKNHFDAEMSSVSGVTIPQLYKANVSNTLGITPGKFTFRAVTGCPQLFEIPETYYKEGVSNESMIYSGKIPNKNDPIVIAGVPSGKSKDTMDEESKIDRNANGRHAVHKAHSKGSTDIHEYVATRSPPERIDIYCFDHLNTGKPKSATSDPIVTGILIVHSYFRTSDQPPPLFSDIAIERVDAHATRFWAEIFGIIHLFTAFAIAFILQFYKFLLYGLIRPLMIGLVQLTSDYFFKPLFTVIYNGITQPLFIFFYNIATSFRDLCLPIAKGIGYFFNEIATLLKAIRLVDWKHTTVATSTKNNAKNV